MESTITFLGFIFLTLGLMEFSMAVYAYNFVTFAAHDAARYASMHGFHSESPTDTNQLRTLVRNQAVALVRSRVIVEPTWIPNNHPGSVVQVRVTYTVNPVVRLMMRDSFNVSSTSRMVIAN